MSLSRRVVRAAGGVLVRPGRGGWRVCLIRRRRHRETGWCLPKGHREGTERLRAAARREVREETGWTGEIVAPLGMIRYAVGSATEPPRGTKRVDFFLMRGLTGGGGVDRREVAAVRWVSFARAAVLLEYATERRVLRRAAAALAR